MAHEKLKDRLGTEPFILDGGMGSQLIARQVVVERCNEALNLDNPDVVEAIHRDYLDAGSYAVITNTFGACSVALARYGLAEQSAEICRAAAEIARRAAGPNRFVIGDIGPCGEFLEPLGTLKPEDLKEAFRIQAQALWDGGVDGFIIETMTALEEAAFAIAAVKEVAPDVAVLSTMAFDVNAGSFRTMMGVEVQTLVSAAVEWGATGVGFNCGSAILEEYENLGGHFARAVESTNLLLVAEPNAGKPELEGSTAVYKMQPEQFADTAERLFEKGIRILGGCCGTGPDHIAAVAKRVGG